jgi:hypothetical protein
MDDTDLMPGTENETWPTDDELGRAKPGVFDWQEGLTDSDSTPDADEDEVDSSQ